MCNLGHAHTHRLRHHRMWISSVMDGARLLYLYLRVHTFYGKIIPPRLFPACRTKHRNKDYYASMVTSMTVAPVKSDVQRQIWVVFAVRASFKESVTRWLFQTRVYMTEHACRSRMCPVQRRGYSRLHDIILPGLWTASWFRREFENGQERRSMWIVGTQRMPIVKHILK